MQGTVFNLKLRFRVPNYTELFRFVFEQEVQVNVDFFKHVHIKTDYKRETPHTFTIMPVGLQRTLSLLIILIVLYTITLTEENASGDSPLK